MNDRHTRTIRRLAWMGIAVALATPAAASAGDGGSNGTSSPARENATLRNDEAHFGTEQRSSTVNAATGQRQSPAPVVVRVDGGFDWVSAGVGAAGGFGLLLVAAAGMSSLRRWHRVDEAQA
jgi:hypothetical protein